MTGDEQDQQRYKKAIIKVLVCIVVGLLAVTIVNLIAPQGIEIKSSRVQMGEFLSKIQYISSYPSRVNIGWLLNLKIFQIQ